MTQIIKKTQRQHLTWVYNNKNTAKDPITTRGEGISCIPAAIPSPLFSFYLLITNDNFIVYRKPEVIFLAQYQVLWLPLALNAMFQQKLLPQIIVHSQQMDLVMRVFCI